MSSKRIPQVIMLFILALQGIGGIILHKAPREPVYDGGDMFFSAFLIFCLLAWGGFWDQKS